MDRLTDIPNSNLGQMCLLLLVTWGKLVMKNA